MPVIADTAYPRLPAEPNAAEMEAFTPEPPKLAFARQRTRQPGRRTRSWQDLHLFRPDTGARYEHIDGLFTATLDWALIEAHLPDMLRVALSSRAGRLLPSAILRRHATCSRKNRLYFASRELGRAIRTDFLPSGSRSVAPAWPPRPSAMSSARW